MARRESTGSPAVLPAATERTAPEVPGPGDESRPADPRIKGSTGGSIPNPLRSARQIAGRAVARIRRSPSKAFRGAVRAFRRSSRVLNRRNARAALAAIVCAALACAVVLDLDGADRIAGYAFALLSGLLALASVREILKDGELDLDLAAAVAAFGSLALYQLL